jgi:hypothetical protein
MIGQRNPTAKEHPFHKKWLQIPGNNTGKGVFQCDPLYTTAR